MAFPTYKDVVSAAGRVEGIVRQTPILTHRELDAKAGRRIYVKCENLQVTGSFKLRGAYNRLVQLSENERKAGVVAFSSGNHAQGIARAAKLLGIPATIVMPADAPEVKKAGVIADGAEIVPFDRRTESREAISNDIAARRGCIIVPAFDDPDIIAGQGTTGLEIVSQLEAMGAAPLSSLYCCVGGGGLIAGISLVMAERSPETSVYGVEPEHYDDFAKSIAAGNLVKVAPDTLSICDALMSPTPGVLTLEINRNNLAGMATVTDAEVLDAMAFAMRYLKLVVEPGGAAALAAVLSGKAEGDGPIGLVLTGGNVDTSVIERALNA